MALVCDNQLYVKPTEGGKVYIGDIVEAPPYPGAKVYFLIEDKFEDREWIGDLIRITPSLFYGTTNEVELADLKKRTRIIYPAHRPQ